MNQKARVEGFRLSPQQKRLWLLQKDDTTLDLRAQCALLVEGPLDAGLLKKALQSLVERHEILRTGCVCLPGMTIPVQVITEGKITWDGKKNLSGVADEERRNAVEALFNGSGRKAFDLEKGHVLHVSPVILAPEKHLLVLSLPSLCADAPTLGILVRELARAYSACSEGGTISDEPMQYADVSEWQNELLESEESRSERDYWREQDVSSLAALELPSEKRSSKGSDRPLPIRRPIDPDTVGRLDALAERRGTSAAVVLLAAWQTLLWRLTGQREVIVGASSDGRSYEELQGVLGPLARYLPVRSRLKGELTFAELMGSLDGTMSDVPRHQEFFSWELLAGTNGNSGRLPYFPFCFDFEKRPEKCTAAGVSFSLLRQSVCFDRFKIRLRCARDEDSLVTEFHYDPDRFSRSDVERLAEQYHRALASAVAGAETALRDIDCLGDAEREELLVAFNRTESPYPRTRCFQELFGEQAGRTPDAVAVAFEERELTYAELDSEANRLARHLQGIGVGPEVLVGIYLEPSSEMVVGLLGALKAGGAYLPLDTGHPEARLSFMLQDARAKVVLTTERLAKRLPAGEARVVLLDADRAAIEAESDEPPTRAALPDNPAYVIYTSGSTGTPKGTVIPHRGLVNYLSWASEVYDVKSGCGTLVHSPLGFDLTVTSLLSPLMLGSRAVILPEAQGAEALENALRAGGDFSLLKLTPAHLDALSQRLPAELVAGRAGALIIGGEALHAEKLAFWREHAPGTRLINEYGPTETVVGCCVHEVAADDPASGAVPIGRPIANTRLYIVDEELRPLPSGVAGELCIGGDGVARGYLNRPGLTAEKFVPDPFGDEPGARLYRTGDLCRRRGDGNLEFLGRIDDQVKILGFRIELGEIETVLQQHDGVREAAVLAREDRPGRKRLVAYWTPVEASKPAVDDLRGFLRDRLPDYMVPSAFVTLEAMPLTPNGKIDRKALPAPEARAGLERPCVGPRTPVEERLAEIWREVLGIERVGVYDNFFELGGDSILSIQVVSKASQAGLKLTPQQMFQHQTIADLATIVGTGPAVEAEQGIVTGPVPLTPIQRWFFERRLREPHHFNQAVLLEVRERLDPELLEQALARLLVHHDALRLRYSRREGGWRQINDDVDDTEVSRVFSRIDLSELPLPERARELEREAARLQANLDLSDGPLLRVALVDMGRGAAGRLLIAIHHLAVDGVSWRILLEDLLSGYAQLSAGHPIQLPPKTTSFRQWSERLAEYARSQELDQELVYWSELTERAVNPLPLDHVDGINDVVSAETVEVSLSEAETAALLHEVPTAYRTQISDVLLTAVARAFRRWTGCGPLRLDLEGHGREELFGDVDLSRTVGWFTSLYPVELELGGRAGPGEALKSVKEQMRRIPRRGIGYGLLRYLRDDERLAATSQVSFNYLGRFDQALPEASPLVLASESSGPVRSRQGRRSHVLEINGGIHDGRLQMVWTYSRNLHERATIEELAEKFAGSLRALIAHCRSAEAGGCTPSDFPLARLDQAALDRLVGRDRGVEDLYPLSPLQSGLLFHSLYAPESGVYFEQLSCRIEGTIDTAAFRRAWQRVVDRHSVLRTAFVWEGLDDPLQIVRRQVELPWEERDWSGLDESERAAKLAAFLDADHARGFELSEAPLMRVAMLRESERAWHFVWSHHHLLLDGWSQPLLLKEVMLEYEAISRGQEPVPERTRPYRDYVGWLAGQDSAAAEGFWRETLRGMTEPTPLPAGRGEGGSSGAYAELRRRLSAETTSKLEALSRKHQLTLNTLVQGAWALLLSRYSGERDVLYGTTVSGRAAPLPGVESMLGLFINTLPVRARIEPHETLLAWLQGLQELQARMREYEHSSLVQVQGWSDVPRGVPLFESLLVFENYPIDRALQQRGGGLSVGEVHFRERTNYPLMLIAAPGPELVLRLGYDESRFEAEAVERLAGHFERLLEGMLAGLERRVDELEMLSADERRRLLVEWNDTAAAPAEIVVHELFEAEAARNPESPALRCGERELSYGELNRRANRLAHHLRDLGVGPDVLVAIGLERSVEMVLGILAVLKAGGAYVPLDPQYPADRLAFMLEDTRAPVLLTSESLSDRLPESGARRVLLGAGGETIAGSEENPASGVAPGSLAYVIYTSGSTGRPKGVEMSHGALANLLAWQLRSWRGEARATTLQFASPSFDVSFQELLSTLGSGGKLVLVDEGLRRDSDALLRQIDEASVERLFLPFVALQHFAEATDRLASIPSCLREVITAGEQLQATPQIARMFADGTQRTLTNQYGPTESHVVTAFDLKGPAEDWPALPPIGRPIDNTQIHLLDPQLNPVPVGVAGELFIGGANVARGYLNRPALTAERFVPDPFGPTPGARLYRTGDLCRRLPDGNIAYLGRIDHQVKIRGYRVELGEIESAIAAFAGVKEAVAIVREDQPGNRRLVAYLVPEGDGGPDERELQNALRGSLPEYMVPASFVRLEALPLSPNGKVDRRRLPAPDGARPELERPYAAPQDALEEKLARIWAEVLGVERVGRDDDFFELGGHSLLATQVVSRLRQAFRVELPLRELFEATTVAALARVIHRAERRPQAPPIEPVPRDGELPLSFAQERQWFLNQLVPSSALYNMPAAVRVRGALDVAVLERSFNEIVRRHEVLRTTFSTEDGRPVQRIAPELPLTIRVVELSDLDEPTREAEVARLSNEEVLKPFRLSEGPLLRLTLLRLNDEDHVLLLTMHHIVSDGWSLGVLLREAGLLYEAFSQDRPSPLGDLAVQYADFANWQREWLQGEPLDEQMAYWKRQLRDLPVLALPTDRPRPALQTFRGATQTFELPETLSADIKALSDREGVTPFMTLLAALQTLLARYSGQRDVVVGSPVANRNRAEIEGLIGFFINNLVLRTDLSGDPGVRELLSRVREVCLGGYAHQDIPFEKLVEELQPDRDLSRAALFQVMFTLQNLPGTARFGDEGPTFEPLNLNTGMVKFDLTLTMWESGDRLCGVWGFNRDLFDPETVARMSEHFRTLLEGFVTDMGRTVSKLPLLKQDERPKLLVEWNDTGTDYPRDSSIHAMFEERVARTPDATAVVFEEEELTYRELNQRANQLARHLQKLGVGSDGLVAVCMERSVEMVVAMLGIVKAGGAYVPLDPDYPEERLSFVLRETRAPVLLSQGPPREFGEDGPRVVRLDEDWPEIARESRADLDQRVDSGDLAYVIYTSGSTGRPKGVALGHRGLCNLALAQQEAFDVRPDDRVLQFASMSFDASVSEVFVTLVAGATLCLARGTEMLPGPSLVDLLERQRISSVTFPPSVLAALPEQDYPHLRTVVSAGEACSAEIVERWSANRRFINAYGPTEGTVCATLTEVTAGDRRPSIGRPMANVSVYVLDPHLEPVPVGVPGELFMGGDGLARGYLREPALTAEKFIPNPFGEPGTRLYRTGDLCRWLPDGTIDFLGRIDHQVKLRGFRIEVEEIEAVLRSHPAVRGAAVVVRKDKESRLLVAYLVPDDEEGPTGAELREYLASKLPAYMVPAAWVMLDSLPLTPSGKLDRRALPAPAATRPESAKYVPPSTPLERYLTETWAEVLHVDRVGIHDNFFELGGDSIQGAILINKLQDKLEQYVYTVALFDAPNVANLARYLVENYPEAVTKIFGAESLGEQTAPVAATVDAAMVDQLRRLVPARTPREPSAASESKNPSMVFILSPPRSGSTLTRVMLGGHPRLFAPPELQLLNFDTLEQRRRAFSNERDKFWLDGTVRSIMELVGCDADRAKSIMEDCHRSELTTKEFYRLLQRWLGDRTLIDKTPHYAMSPETLGRAELDFENARYIHLTRHPGAMIGSFLEAKLHVFFPPFLSGKHGFSPRQLAELVWIVCHRNILSFLEGIPAERQHRLNFESLVRDPKAAMEEVARFLDVEFDTDMLQPHKETKSRMTDPIHPMAKMLGDIKFHEHKSIDPEAADRWKERLDASSLSETTWELAASLGYEREIAEPRAAGATGVTAIRPRRRDDRADDLLDKLDQLSEEEVSSLLGEIQREKEES